VNYYAICTNCNFYNPVTTWEFYYGKSLFCKRCHYIVYLNVPKEQKPRLTLIRGGKEDEST